MLVRPVVFALFTMMGLALPVMSVVQSAGDAIRVVYHLNEGTAQVARAMGNIRNHLAADSKAKIQAVTHGRGIDCLLKGAKKPSGVVFSDGVEELALRGIDFKICSNTLRGREIDPARVVADGKIVPSGVAEVARLQAMEGYVYPRPKGGMAT